MGNGFAFCTGFGKSKIDAGLEMKGIKAMNSIDSMESEAKEKITGVIDEITHYYEERDGFTVMEVISDGDCVTVVGNFPRLAEGEQVVLQGEWSVHPVYGRQFRAELLQHSLPKDTDGIYHYLSSGIIKGVGESTAMAIVRAFGEESFNVIENDVNRLSAVPKVGKRRAASIQKEFKAAAKARETVEKLTEIGLRQDEALKAFQVYGIKAFEVISENPYEFVGVGYSFERAEEIAPNVESEDLDENRCIAGAVYTVRRNLSNGHTCVPRDVVVKKAAEYLGCGEDYAEIAVDTAIDMGQLASAELKGREFLFTPEIYEAESQVADRIKVMAECPPVKIEVFEAEIREFEKRNKIEFDEKQKRAIETAVNKGQLILTGGPGTGKTTTVKAMITLMKAKGLNVVLAAPTGRAAKRMSELTGYEAKTIHRLLEAKKGEGEEETRFTYNRKKLLKVDAVIVDELSMVDITLFYSLLDALPMSVRLIMVGDKNQLPPVGAGNVLGDLVESEIIDVIELKKIFRQAEESKIVVNAHKVVKGQMPDIKNEDANSDFFFMKEYVPERCAEKVVELVEKRLPEGYGLNPFEGIQVLCPGRKGMLGSENLNIMLQAVLNPKMKNKKELPRRGYVLREGDKVMQTKNNYDIELKKAGETITGVYNGDIGVIRQINAAAGVIIISFDGAEALYPAENAGDLELAYAMTVHKSQGSEFEAVVMPVLSVPEKLQYRNLFYTALTRAKGLFVLLGSEKVVENMVNNDKKSRRYSALKEFLTVN